MRLIVVASVFILAVCAPALAQKVMDGSDKKLAPAVRKSLLSSIDAISRDPYRTELRRVHVGAGGVFCGEANVPNTYGGFSGFSRFYADLPKHDGLIDLATIPEMHGIVAPQIDALCGQ